MLLCFFIDLKRSCCQSSYPFVDGRVGNLVEKFGVGSSPAISVISVWVTFQFLLTLLSHPHLNGSWSSDIHAAEVDYLHGQALGTRGNTINWLEYSSCQVMPRVLARRARVFMQEFSFEISSLQQYPQTPDVLLYGLESHYNKVWFNYSSAGVTTFDLPEYVLVASQFTRSQQHQDSLFSSLQVKNPRKCRV